MKNDLISSCEDAGKSRSSLSREIDSLKKVTYASRETARSVKYFSEGIEPGAYATRL